MNFANYSIVTIESVSVPITAKYMRLCLLSANADKLKIYVSNIKKQVDSICTKIDSFASSIDAKVDDDEFSEFKSKTFDFVHHNQLLDVSSFIDGYRLENTYGVSTPNDMVEDSNYVTSNVVFVPKGSKLAFNTNNENIAYRTYVKNGDKYTRNGSANLSRLTEVDGHYELQLNNDEECIRLQIAKTTSTLPYRSGDLIMTLAEKYDASDKEYGSYTHLNKDVKLYDDFVKEQYLDSDIREKLKSIKDNTYCNYNGNEFMSFNKILCIGDSLTDGQFDYYDDDGVRHEFNDKTHSYPNYLHRISNAEVTNKGDAGESTRTWFEKHGTEDLSGHDVCIIALGLNDSNGGTSVITTHEERMTALANIVNKVKSDNNGIKIFITTIFRCFTGSEKDPVNTDIRDFASATSDVYLIDLWNYGNVVNKPEFVAGHLTAFGYRQLAYDIFSYASYIMSNNPTEFRFIQYTGTDKHYQ